MIIELASKQGPFQSRPWLEVAVTMILGTILLLVAESLGAFPKGTTLWVMLATIPIGILFAQKRQRDTPRTRRVRVTDDQAENIKKMIADGTDDQAVKQAIHRLQSEGFKKSEAELAVLHFFHQVNPTRLRMMAPFFETREISDGPSLA